MLITVASTEWSFNKCVLCISKDSHVFCKKAPKQIELVHRKEKELKVYQAIKGGTGIVENVEVFFQIGQASWDTRVNM